MRKIVYSMMVSLDGYVEDPGGGIGWSEPAEDVHRYSNDAAREAGLFLMGRRLYETMVPFWPETLEKPYGIDYVDEFAQVWVPKPKFVYSRTLDSVEANSMLTAEIDVEEILELKRLPGGSISIGGAELASGFAARGLIDEVELLIQPAVTGGGKPFFGPGFAGSGFSPLEARRFDSGTLLARYAVEPPVS